MAQVGFVLLFAHCIQRDAPAASQRRYRSCQHLKANSSPHICIKGDTGIAAAFSDDAKKRLLLNVDTRDLFSSLNFAFITNTCNTFMGDSAMSANVK